MSVHKPLVIIGAGEFAQIACEYFQHDSDYTVVAFSVERDFLLRPTLAELPVVAFEELEQRYPPAQYEVFVAIPATRLNRLRTRFFQDMLRRGYRCASYVSSRAFVWRNAQIGANCFLFEGNVIQPFTRIGDNCILWSGNHIGHRTVVQDNVFIASHAVISGYCEIGRGSFIGVNATLSDKVRIAADNIIGAGALVTRHTEPERVYVGSPARAVAGRSSFDVAL
ncbi:sugar O-acyltransferase (sialic acid O-acetyltransferase NeuD family) [Xanthomonas arboricola]|uniref:acetyltransferase n=1 Tax=Xanthomonas TaxID=338 RepID=UPI000CEE04EE|nr:MULTISPECIES: acetyltransferase [Xanthomonas]MBB5769548.1 sugar O-acyltransferase (sialic acid O-acetyltransferase NeuD family) [Xanthomonas euroxanthea]NIK07300.1 sugar O-acyltransferase (sialic acid O-acetyltransferase NeuD family) [Xanthomonas euroxanthea]NJC36175.1 sugar O-acyltransferase (sialic acid O-acetyltransferase NeuD family) [Xanthomonas euroxanthea]PPT42842.1 sugar O-acyltransferase [Xanthomonas arboricola]